MVKITATDSEYKQKIEAVAARINRIIVKTKRKRQIFFIEINQGKQKNQN